MTLMHLPARHIGVGDLLVLSGGQGLPVSVTVWNALNEGDGGMIRFYVRESTTWQIAMHEDSIAAVIR